MNTGSRKSEKNKKAVKGVRDVDGLISERGGESIHEAVIIQHDLCEIICVPDMIWNWDGEVIRTDEIRQYTKLN